MLTESLLSSVRTILDNDEISGRFSLPQLKLQEYSEMTPAQCRGLGKQFFDSVVKGFLNTNTYKIVAIEGTHNPQIYEKIQYPIPVSTYPPETLLKDATPEQIIERTFEIFFTRIARRC